MHGSFNSVHIGSPVGSDVLTSRGLGVHKLAVDSDFESSRSLGVTNKLVVEVFFAEFCIHVLHRFDSVLAVASASAVLNANGNGAGAKLF